MNEMLRNKIENYLVENKVLTDEEAYAEIKVGIEELDEMRNNIDRLIVELKRAILDNSIHLLHERIMNENLNGVIQMLDNNRNVIDMYNYLEKKEELLKAYLQYNLLYSDKYPELKEVKEMLGLKDKELVGIMREIITNHNVVTWFNK